MNIYKNLDGKLIMSFYKKDFMKSSIYRKITLRILNVQRHNIQIKYYLSFML